MFLRTVREPSEFGLALVVDLVLMAGVFGVFSPVLFSAVLVAIPTLRVLLQFPGNITDSIKSLNLAILVYTPGAFIWAHSRPQLTTPTNWIVPSGALATKGPPESPYVLKKIVHNSMLEKQKFLFPKLTWQASLPPSKWPAQSCTSGNSLLVLRRKVFPVSVFLQTSWSIIGRPTYWSSQGVCLSTSIFQSFY